MDLKTTAMLIEKLWLFHAVYPRDRADWRAGLSEIFPRTCLFICQYMPRKTVDRSQI
jgi:hypothetical protein